MPALGIFDCVAGSFNLRFFDGVDSSLQAGLMNGENHCVKFFLAGLKRPGNLIDNNLYTSYPEIAALIGAEPIAFPFCKSVVAHHHGDARMQ